MAAVAVWDSVLYGFAAVCVLLALAALVGTFIEAGGDDDDG